MCGIDLCCTASGKGVWQNDCYTTLHSGQPFFFLLFYYFFFSSVWIIMYFCIKQLYFPDKLQKISYTTCDGQFSALVWLTCTCNQCAKLKPHEHTKLILRTTEIDRMRLVLSKSDHLCKSIVTFLHWEMKNKNSYCISIYFAVFYCIFTIFFYCKSNSNRRKICQFLNVYFYLIGFFTVNNSNF